MQAPPRQASNRLSPPTELLKKRQAVARYRYLRQVA
jgi:hypothetical protein